MTPFQGSLGSDVSETQAIFATRVRAPEEPTLCMIVVASTVVVTYAGKTLARVLFFMNIASSMDLPLIAYTTFTTGSNVV